MRSPSSRARRTGWPASSPSARPHFYLFWLYHADNNLFLSGGFAGIMGKNGLIGSPLDRPYLHYTYNFIVLVPMMIAVWDDARRVDRVHSRRTEPRSASASALGRDVTS